jgi:uncharacterized protein YciI
MTKYKMEVKVTLYREEEIEAENEEAAKELVDIKDYNVADDFFAFEAKPVSVEVI